jgi:hypothetical protein
MEPEKRTEMMKLFRGSRVLLYSNNPPIHHIGSEMADERDLPWTCNLRADYFMIQ